MTTYFLGSFDQRFATFTNIKYQIAARAIVFKFDLEDPFYFPVKGLAKSMPINRRLIDKNSGACN